LRYDCIHPDYFVAFCPETLWQGFLLMPAGFTTFAEVIHFAMMREE
jgi:hypothetical protein